MRELGRQPGWKQGFYITEEGGNLYCDFQQEKANKSEIFRKLHKSTEVQFQPICAAVPGNNWIMWSLLENHKFLSIVSKFVQNFLTRIKTAKGSQAQPQLNLIELNSIKGKIPLRPIAPATWPPGHPESRYLSLKSLKSGSWNHLSQMSHCHVVTTVTEQLSR